MRISDLLQLGKQLLPETYMRRAEIERLVPPDNHMEIVSIELGALLRGDKSQDLFLQAQDRVLIYSVYDFQDQPVVRVTGAVRRPGEYRLFPEMTIRDLIFRAGGLSRRAYTLEAELSRIVSAHEQQTPARTILIPIQLAEALNGNPIANIRLQELDTLFIRNLPEWVAIVNKVVQLSGEVKFPGEYAFEQGERLSSVIRRAGGFTEQAFPKGAVFTREAVRLEQEQQLREVLELAQVEALQLGVEAAGAETEEQRAVRQQAVSAQRQLLEIIAARRPTGRMVIRLHDPDTLEGTPDDVELQPGDRLYVPPIPSSINVVGGVFRAGAVVFLEGAGLDYYLDRVGGLTDFAVEKKIRLIKANGTVLELKGKRRGNPFFRRSRFAEDREGQIELGDTIFVPVKFEEEIQVVALTQTLVDVMFKTAVTIAAIVAAF
jgi:protein involved in polysaccharide export with SLBB domain